MIKLRPGAMTRVEFFRASQNKSRRKFMAADVLEDIAQRCRTTHIPQQNTVSSASSTVAEHGASWISSRSQDLRMKGKG
ncbi:hypothetical protein E2C01_059046 [Portunus trituberculatus]|uniref:Uncharacterized protein n=1 Tax=Portunus trituberculatus TaxID=210409 RepID=A0A5B7H806_PORTR|nr:hypothetical protein [Portunus trituberculatus]